MRLIDADKLILHLNDYALQEAPFRGESADAYNAIKQCIEAVEEQPTAYDIEEVVDELKEVHEKFCKNVACDELCEHCEEYIMFNKNIKIVKQGGVSDDVCEWKYNDTEYYWKSSCDNLHIFMSDGPKENEYRFCPYCGKKIKEVE